MTAAAGPRPEEFTNEGLWFRVETVSKESVVRRAAERLARQLQLGEERIAELSIVTAELVSNLVKHAREGMLLLRPVRDGDEAGVELIAIDTGPGMIDLIESSRDGHSTTGTLGIGLGSIIRQASWYDGYSLPGQGTVLVVQVWPGRAPEPAWAAGLTRPLTGESVSGDGFAVRVCDGRHQVLVCDGLGHGPLAAAATRAAVQAFRTAPVAPPVGVLEYLHRSMRHTRGAALAVAELDRAAAVARYAGLGNINGSVVDGSTRRGMVSLPGIAGHQGRALREYVYPLATGSVVLMHTDGVTDRWQIDNYPGLLGRSPVLIATTVLRDHGIRRDDACVLAAQAPA